MFERSLEMCVAFTTSLTLYIADQASASGPHSTQSESDLSKNSFTLQVGVFLEIAIYPSLTVKNNLYCFLSQSQWCLALNKDKSLMKQLLHSCWSFSTDIKK